METKETPKHLLLMILYFQTYNQSNLKNIYILVFTEHNKNIITLFRIIFFSEIISLVKCNNK